jgi:demethoxyubiquinone hydroxylase (CLK1/Coq7/Cat5 family)
MVYMGEYGLCSTMNMALWIQEMSFRKEEIHLNWLDNYKIEMKFKTPSFTLRSDVLNYVLI